MKNYSPFFCLFSLPVCCLAFIKAQTGKTCIRIAAGFSCHLCGTVMPIRQGEKKDTMKLFLFFSSHFCSWVIFPYLLHPFACRFIGEKNRNNLLKFGRSHELGF